MTPPGPIEPEFGQALPVSPRADKILEFLATRRSCSAITLKEPGPKPDDVDLLLRLAARVPDHGKLFPWRFLVIEGAAKRSLADGLARLAESRDDAPKAKAAIMKLTTPPLSIAVISRPTESHIPEWEQILSSGAVCMNLLMAAGAMGYGANWITEWYAYDEAARALLGLSANERIAGFVHVGTPADAPLERARPTLSELVRPFSSD